MPRKSKADLEIRAAGETENLPVYIPDEMIEDGNPLDWEQTDDVVSVVATPIDGDLVTSDSTGTTPSYSSSVESMLAYKEVSVTELFEDGSRGHRMYLGKPSLDTFNLMRKRSKGVGVVIEADGAAVEYLR